MSNSTYKQKIISIFGADLGTKILALIDPCSAEDLDCSLYKVCETLTSLTYDDGGTNITIIYTDEDGGVTSIVILIKPSIISATWSGVYPFIVISVALPVKCCEFLAPPTLLL